MNPRINPVRLLLSVLAVFVVATITDILIHGVWLGSAYHATPDAWRPEKDMQDRMWVMFLAHGLVAVAITLIYARIATTASLVCAVVYGVCVGLLADAGHLMSYMVYKVPGDIAVKWVISGPIQGILLMLTAFYVYKPAKE